MNEWKKYRLDDFAKVIMGLSPSGDTYNKEQNGMPLLNGPTEFGDTHPNCTIYTTDSKRVCKAKDLIFCVRGSTTGRMNWADKPYSLGRGVCSITGIDDLTTKFLKHLLTANLEGLLQITSGGTFPNLNKEDINGFTFRAPIGYRKIAQILSNYDELIENNFKRIKLLEESARLTYEEWFLRFRIDGKKLEIDPETDLPFGWQDVFLTDYIELLRGVEPGSSKYEEVKTDSNIPFIRVGDLSKRDSDIYVSKDLTNNKIIDKDDILLSLDGSPGMVKFGLSGCYSTGIRKAISKQTNISSIFIYNLLNSPYIQGLIEAYASGATILHAGSSVKKMRFVLPTDEVLDKYNNIEMKKFQLILNLLEQNNFLRKARDILLPRLMTGKINIDDLDIAV